MCVAEKKEGVFSLLFLPPSLLVSPTVYPTPLFSIFTCSSRCEGSEILNYRNWLVSALWLYQKQPSLFCLLTWHTLSHILITAQPVYEHSLQVKGGKHSNAWYTLLKWFECDLRHYLFSFSSIHPPHCVRVKQQPPQLDEALAEASQFAVPVKATRCCSTVLQLNDLKQNTLSHYSSVMSCTLEIQENRKIEVWAFLAAESLSRNVVISNLVEWNE